MQYPKHVNKTAILKAWIELGQPLLTDDPNHNRDLCMSIRQMTGHRLLEIRRALQEFCGSQYNPLVLKARAIEQYCAVLERDIKALQQQVDDKRKDLNNDVYYWALEHHPEWLNNMVQQEPNFRSTFDTKTSRITVEVRKPWKPNTSVWEKNFIEPEDLLK